MRFQPGLERFTIAMVIGACAGLTGYVGLRGVALPAIPALLAALACGVAGVYWLAPRLPDALTGILRARPALSAAWFLLAVAGLVQITRLSAFMLDPSDAHLSIIPEDEWLVHHCCLTAYTEGARLASEGDANIYTNTHYTGRKVDGFNVDQYEYPPTFLVLPVVLRALAGGDFLRVREIWFSAGALTLMLALGLTAFRMEPAGRLRIIGMAPLIWCSTPVLVGFQMSNVQILVFATSVLALVLFTFRTPAGAFALAASMVAKIFPGMLFIYLLVRRRWRAVAWTTAAGIVLTVIAFVVVGEASFRSFFEYQVPRLSSGEAFAGPFSRASGVARNMTPFGIPLKLAQLGVPGMSLAAGRLVSLTFLAVIVLLAVRAGRREPRSGTEAASVWLSLVCLGTLVSPFAPGDYALVGVVWLVCMDRELFRPGQAVMAWLVICLPFLVSRSAPFALQAAAFFPAQILAIGVPVWVLWKAGSPSPAEAAPTGQSALTLRIPSPEGFTRSSR